MHKIIFKYFYSGSYHFPIIYNFLTPNKFTAIIFIGYFFMYNLCGSVSYALAMDDEAYTQLYDSPNFFKYSLTVLGIYLFLYTGTNYLYATQLIFKTLKQNVITHGWLRLSILNFSFIPFLFLSFSFIAYPIFLLCYNLMNFQNIIVGIIISTLTACVLNELILFKDLLSLTTLKIKKIPFLYIICYSFIGTALYVDIGYVANGLVIAFLFALFLVFSFINLFILKKCSFQLK